MTPETSLPAAQKRSRTPSAPNKDLFDASVDELRSDFDTAGDIMIRDGKILTAAGI